MSIVRVRSGRTRSLSQVVSVWVVFVKNLVSKLIKCQDHKLTLMVNIWANTIKKKPRGVEISKNKYHGSRRAVSGLRGAGGAEGADCGSGGVARLQDESAEGAAVGGAHGHCAHARTKFWSFLRKLKREKKIKEPL
jgi:hypothetical protein